MGMCFDGIFCLDYNSEWYQMAETAALAALDCNLFM